MQCSVALAGCITLKGRKVTFAMYTRVILVRVGVFASRQYNKQARGQTKFHQRADERWCFMIFFAC